MAFKQCAVLVLALGVCGCGATLPGLSTGSLFGGDAPKAAPVAQNDVASRALQVGGTVARAQKCGFNFDALKLRTQFIAAESALNPADAANATQLYDVAYRGTSRAITGRGEDYCSGGKTTAIKAALTRHMAGDYAADAFSQAAGADITAGVTE